MPDLTAFEISQLAQISKMISETDKDNTSPDFSRSGKYGILNQISIYMPISDFYMPRFIGISVSSFANIHVISMLFMNICFLRDDSFVSYKARFVTKFPKSFGVAAFRFLSEAFLTYVR